MKALQLIGLIVALILIGFGYYAISPLFINVKMNEPLPSAQEVQDERGIDVMTEKEPPSANITPVQSGPKPIVDTPAHPASGTVQIVSDGDKTYVRYENLKTINGPDIYVYLAKDLAAKEFVSLGRVKATEGNVNYEIPAGTDPRDYPYVLIWCKAFGVLFNYADFSQ